MKQLLWFYIMFKRGLAFPPTILYNVYIDISCCEEVWLSEFTKCPICFCSVRDRWRCSVDCYYCETERLREYLALCEGQLYYWPSHHMVALWHLHHHQHHHPGKFHQTVTTKRTDRTDRTGHATSFTLLLMMTGTSVCLCACADWTLYY